MKIRHTIIVLIALMMATEIFNNYFSSSMYHAVIMETLAILMAICLCLTVYLIIRNIFRAIKRLLTRQSNKELEHQREIERKENDVLRKSNEILLHLMHDQHREQ